jgi:F0F1-type ATP synthase assembly protein I
MKRNYFEIDKHGDLKKTNQGFKKKQETKKSFFTDNVNINVGYSLITPILLGVIIGLALDSRFHSKPVFTVLFIFLGTISSFYNLYKLTK